MTVWSPRRKECLYPETEAARGAARKEWTDAVFAGTVLATQEVQAPARLLAGEPFAGDAAVGSTLRLAWKASDRLISEKNRRLTFHQAKCYFQSLAAGDDKNHG